MGLVTLIMTFALLAVCGSSALAQQKPAPRTASAFNNKDISPAALRQLFTTYREVYQTLFFTGSTQPCVDPECEVTIWLQSVTIKTREGVEKEYCIAAMPESLLFRGTATGNQPKTIRWTLSTGNLGGRIVEFHNDNGILKVDDGKSQFVPDPHRTSPTVFEATNKHKQKGSATYLPVIIFRTTNGEPELCAAGDPKIVNN